MCREAGMLVLREVLEGGGEGEEGGERGELVVEERHLMEAVGVVGRVKSSCCSEE